MSAGGTAKWAIPPPDMWLDPYPVTLVGSMLIFGSWEGFHGVRPSDGQPLWSQRVLLPPLDPTALQSATAVGATLAGEFVIAGANHKLFIADTAGNIRVTAPNSAAIILGWFPVVGSDGSSYFSVLAVSTRVASFSVDGVRRWPHRNSELRFGPDPEVPGAPRRGAAGSHERFRRGECLIWGRLERSRTQLSPWSGVEADAASCGVGQAPQSEEPSDLAVARDGVGCPRALFHASAAVHAGHVRHVMHLAHGA